MEPYIAVLRDFGVAVACLFGLAIAVWKTARWTAEKVILPITAAHLGLVTKVQEAVEKMADNSTRQTQELVRIGTDLREVHSLVIHTNNVAIQQSPNSGQQNTGGSSHVKSSNN